MRSKVLRRIDFAVVCIVSISAIGAAPKVHPSAPGASRTVRALTTLQQVQRAAAADATGPSDAFGPLSVSNVDTGEAFASLQMAIDDADTLAGHTLEVTVGQLFEGPQIVVDKDLTIRGDGTNVVKPVADTGAGGDARGWFLVQPGVELHVQDLAFDGDGQLIYQAFRHKGSGSFTNCAFEDIQFNASGPDYSGVAIAAFGDGAVDIVNCAFSSIGRIGVLYFGAGVSGSEFVGNTYTGKGDGDFLDYACDISAGAEVLVQNCMISDCRGVASTDGSTSAGLLVSTFFGPGTDALITNCTFSGNSTGIFAGFDAADTSTVGAYFNNIMANTTFGVVNVSSTTIVDAKDNWWGHVNGPDDPPGAVPAINNACVAPADIFNVNPSGDAVTDANVCYCPWAEQSLGAPPSGTLRLEVAPCIVGAQMTVDLWMRGLTGPVTGYQAFLEYDDTALTYRGDLSSYTSTPFPLHIQDIAIAEVAAGLLRVDGSDALGDSGTIQEALLVRLVFDVDVTCVSTSIDFDLTQFFDSELSFDGVAVPTTLVATGPVTLDSVPPVIDPCPANIMTPADAGSGSGCTSAIVTFTTPGATDDCTGVTVACVPPSGSVFPVGTTSVVCTATDDCGNESSCMFDVTVTPDTVIEDLEIELVGVTLPVTRCIRLVADSCSAAIDVELSFIDHDANPLTGVRAMTDILLPCGPWTMICAKDEQHTLWGNSTLSLSGDGTTLIPDNLIQLRAGDNDNDGDVDIQDITFLIAEFGDPEPNGGCPWNGVRGTDFSNNGNVGSEDYSLLSPNWLTLTDCSCTTFAGTGDAGTHLRTSLFVSEVDAGLARRADLNRDGVIDAADVALFETRHGLPATLSTRMRALDRRLDR